MVTTAHAPAFSADQFTPTQWATAEDKARWANQFMRFWRSGFLQNLFTKTFYTRLSMTFGHIAHYNQLGFWDEFFADEGGKSRFMAQTRSYRPVGDPAWSYADVERAIQKYLAAHEA